VILHPLFHWAPTSRRDAIAEQGLVPSSAPTCSSQSYAYVCCCLSPSQAWALSALAALEPIESWDCWQIVLNPDSPVEVLPFWGNRLEEIRINGAVLPDQLWLVGSRSNSNDAGKAR